LASYPRIRSEIAPLTYPVALKVLDWSCKNPQFRDWLGKSPVPVDWFLDRLGKKLAEYENRHATPAAKKSAPTATDQPDSSFDGQLARLLSTHLAWKENASTVRKRAEAAIILKPLLLEQTQAQFEFVRDAIHWAYEDEVRGFWLTRASSAALLVKHFETISSQYTLHLKSATNRAKAHQEGITPYVKSTYHANNGDRTAGNRDVITRANQRAEADAYREAAAEAAEE